MLVITGIFEDGRFIPDKPVTIPEKKKVKVIVEDHLADASGIEKTTEWSIEKRISLAENLVGVASNNPMSLEEIRNERLARQ